MAENTKIADGAENAENTVLSGGCLCGAVRFELRPPLRPVVACHCGQCRKWSGHYIAATAVRPENFLLLKEESLRWFDSSPEAKRGFCGVCGSSLFWRPKSGAYTAVVAGAVDNKTGLRLAAHIFTEDKGDYYEIAEADDISLHPTGGARLEIP